MKNIDRLAALANLSLRKEEAERIAAEIPEILRLTAHLASCPETGENGVMPHPLASLREDQAAAPDTARVLLHLSPRADGETVRVARTVGGQDD